MVSLCFRFRFSSKTVSAERSSGFKIHYEARRVKMSKINGKRKEKITRKRIEIKDCFGFRLFQQHDATRNSITMMSIQSGHAKEHITITIWTTLTKCCCLWCMLFRQHLIFFSCNQIHRSALLKAAFSGEKWLVV
jgi:hypothetical protein